MPPKTTTYVYTNHANLDKKKFHGELEQLYLKMPEIKGRIQKDRSTANCSGIRKSYFKEHTEIEYVA